MKLFIDLLNKSYRNNVNIENIYLDFNKINNTENHQLKIIIDNKKDIDDKLNSKKVFDLGLIIKEIIMK